MSYHNISKEGKWKANFIKISKDERNEIRLCGDRKSEYDKFSKWGVHTSGIFTFLEPYQFSNEVLKMLILFIDKYLELLQSVSCIKKENQIDDHLLHNLEIFEKYHLGF